VIQKMSLMICKEKKSDSTHLGDDFSASTMNVDPNSSRGCEFVLAEK